MLDISSLLSDNISMETRERTLRIFVDISGRSPFETWMGVLSDKATKARILTRIDRLRLGNFGDCAPVGEGVFELKMHFGPGIRVYFGLLGSEVVLLLCGGDKRSQKRDIVAAKRYWQEYIAHDRNI